MKEQIKKIFGFAATPEAARQTYDSLCEKQAATKQRLDEMKAEKRRIAPEAMGGDAAGRERFNELTFEIATAEGEIEDLEIAAAEARSRIRAAEEVARQARLDAEIERFNDLCRAREQLAGEIETTMTVAAQQLDRLLDMRREIEGQLGRCKAAGLDVPKGAVRGWSPLNGDEVLERLSLFMAGLGACHWWFKFRLPTLFDPKGKSFRESERRAHEALAQTYGIVDHGPGQRLLTDQSTGAGSAA